MRLFVAAAEDRQHASMATERVCEGTTFRFSGNIP